MSNSTTTTKKSAHGAGWLLNLFSFVAVICIGVALMLSKIGALGSVAGALLTIAQTIAYIVVSIVSFFYVYKKRRLWIWIVWAISIVLIVLSYVLVF